MAALDFTGERFIPGAGAGIKLEHLHRYALCRELVVGKRVLDIASGEGYGSALLAQSAGTVTGVDIAPEAVEHATARYAGRANLSYRVGSCAAIPLPDASVDVVVSFETIEHHTQHEQMMREVRRVLVPGGLLVISSPDKRTYSDLPGYQNPYHVKELYLDELRSLLESHFANVEYFGQRVGIASLVTPIGRVAAAHRALACEGDAIVEGTVTPGAPIYFLCLCSDAPLPKADFTSSFVDTVEDGLQQLVDGYGGQAARADAAQQQLNETQRHAQALSAQIAALDAHIRLMQRSFSWRLTRPLRGAARVLRDPRGAAKRAFAYAAGPLRTLYRSLPIPGRLKAAAKSLVYGRLGFLLAGSASYEHWRTVQRGFTVQPVRGPLREPGPRRYAGPPWVLVVDDRTPRPDSDAGSLKILNYIRILQSLGYRVASARVDAAHERAAADILEGLGVDCLHAPAISSIAEHLAEEGDRYDVIYSCRPDPTAQLLETFRQLAPFAKILFDTGDLHFVREERQAKLTGDARLFEISQWRKRQEFGIAAAVDCTIVVSEAERSVLLDERPELKVEVISAVHDIAQAPAPFDARRDIVFIGGYKHLPNVDAVRYFTQEIWPLVRTQLPGVRFLVVGSDPPAEFEALASDDVIIVGHVADLGACLDRCRVAVNPLRYGAGVKGKIVSAMAAGLPGVGTGIAAEGMALRDGEDFLVADTPTEFAAAVVRLYEDPATWTRLAANGLRVVEDRYSFRAGTERFRCVLAAVGATPGRTAAGDDTEAAAREARRDRFSYAAVASRAEYLAHVAASEEEYRRRAGVEHALRQDADSFTVAGRCRVCARPADFLVDYQFCFDTPQGRIPNWRERLVCPSCGLPNRVRGAIDLWRSLFRPGANDAVYATEQKTPFFAWLRSNYPQAIGSEYLGDAMPPGASDATGLRNESLLSLTFADASFDHLLSFDVLEHIPDYRAALRECLRVLKPGGVFFFSVPFAPGEEAHVVRARVDAAGQIEHVLPPEYHGDPLSEAGCLCFYHFGWQLLTELREIGFEAPAAHLFWSRRYGYLGHEQLLLSARRPSAATATAA
jgi:ubiquinone/menaquinone biosynthesis C-methylase UbiE/glycosyltransferase involved in cell wall biosynthesis